MYVEYEIEEVNVHLAPVAIFFLSFFVSFIVFSFFLSFR